MFFGSSALRWSERDLAELLRFFFEPVDLVFELADLLVEFRFTFLQCFGLVVFLLREDLRKVLEKGLLRYSPLLGPWGGENKVIGPTVLRC